MCWFYVIDYKFLLPANQDGKKKHEIDRNDLTIVRSNFFKKAVHWLLFVALRLKCW